MNSIDRDPLLELALRVLDDKKAQDVVVVDVGGKTLLADYFVICTATSTAHAHAMADSLHFECKHAGHPQAGQQAQRSDSWKLLDFGNVVVHVFLAEERAYYDLEKMWTQAPDLPSVDADGE